MAVGRAEVLRIKEPGTAANDTAATVTSPPRRAVRGCTLVAVVEAILHPFPDVAVHVVEAERIGGERADRRRLLVVPLAAAAVAVGVALADLVAPGIGRLGAGARGIFPFRLGQQPVGLPVILESQATYCWASSQVTLITGCRPRPQPLSLTPESQSP